MMSSAAVPVKNIPGIVKAIPGSGENRSPSRRNRCSPSARNPVRLHPGMLFTFTPESFSPSPGIRSHLYGQDDPVYYKMRKIFGRKPDLASPERQESLLQFLNEWRCRIAEEGFPKLKERLQQWWAENQCKLPDVGKNIGDLDDNDREQVGRAYEELLKLGAGLRFQDTAAAKTLHALRPDTLPIWDAKIKKRFRERGAGQTYSDFIRYVAHEEIAELEVDVTRLGLPLGGVPQLVHPGSGVSLVKLVDEYYWTTITLDYVVPTRGDLEKWLGWMPGQRGISGA
jgi:hypothetical protein